MLSKFMHEFTEATRKLAQFRRHSDWSAAFERTLNKHPDLFIVLEDGRKAIHEKSFPLLWDLTDHEFFEEIIRREPKQIPNV